MAKGYRAFPVNPQAEEIDGQRCYPNLRALPKAVDGVVMVVPPAETSKTL